MNLRVFGIAVWFFPLLLMVGCKSEETTERPRGSYLYLGPDVVGQLPRYGDVVTPSPTGAKVIGIFSGRDTTVAELTNKPQDNSPVWMALRAGAELGEDYLTAKPFVYTIDSAAYWASFEPSFTGFPEFARPGAKDFINRMGEWDGVAPGLEYTEYAVRRVGGQSLLFISERLRGQYINTFAVIVDTLDEGGFGGRLLRQSRPIAGKALPAIRFERTVGIATTYSASDFVEVVNEGFSRSYLLFPPAPISDSEMVRAGNRLPRRALIDSNDPGRISASFLPDGRFMLLTDEQVALEGDYTLDLDKGILTVDDGKTTTFRIFITVAPKISFTLPVSVLSLAGTKMVGTDNYLRIEVVQLE